MNNFLKRTFSGFFFVVIIIGSILISPYTFVLAFAIISAWTVFEFHKLTNKQNEVEAIPMLSIIGSVILFLTSFFYASEKIMYPVYSVYGLYVVLVLIVELYRKKKNPIHNWAYFLLGQIVIALPFSLLNYILYIETYHPLLLIAMFATIWINDTGAYLVGITIGKHRMFERISPKKSWEGFFGGLILSIAASFILSQILIDLNPFKLIGMAIIVSVVGTFGDLLESKIKRSSGLKDSGCRQGGSGPSL